MSNYQEHMPEERRLRVIADAQIEARLGVSRTVDIEDRRTGIVHHIPTYGGQVQAFQRRTLALSADASSRAWLAWSHDRDLHRLRNLGSEITDALRDAQVNVDRYSPMRFTHNTEGLLIARGGKKRKLCALPNQNQCTKDADGEDVWEQTVDGQQICVQTFENVLGHGDRALAAVQTLQPKTKGPADIRAARMTERVFLAGLKPIHTFDAQAYVLPCKHLFEPWPRDSQLQIDEKNRKPILQPVVDPTWSHFWSNIHTEGDDAIHGHSILEPQPPTLCCRIEKMEWKTRVILTPCPLNEYQHDHIGNGTSKIPHGASPEYPDGSHATSLWHPVEYEYLDGGRRVYEKQAAFDEREYALRVSDNVHKDFHNWSHSQERERPKTYKRESNDDSVNPAWRLINHAPLRLAEQYQHFVDSMPDGLYYEMGEGHWGGLHPESKEDNELPEHTGQEGDGTDNGKADHRSVHTESRPDPESDGVWYPSVGSAKYHSPLSPTSTVSVEFNYEHAELTDEDENGVDMGCCEMCPGIEDALPHLTLARPATPLYPVDLDALVVTVAATEYNAQKELISDVLRIRNCEVFGTDERASISRHMVKTGNGWVYANDVVKAFNVEELRYQDAPPSQPETEIGESLQRTHAELAQVLGETTDKPEREIDHEFAGIKDVYDYYRRSNEPWTKRHTRIPWWRDKDNCWHGVATILYSAHITHKEAAIREHERQVTRAVEDALSDSVEVKALKREQKKIRQEEKRIVDGAYDHKPIDWAVLYDIAVRLAVIDDRLRVLTVERELRRNKQTGALPNSIFETVRETEGDEEALREQAQEAANQLPLRPHITISEDVADILKGKKTLREVLIEQPELNAGQVRQRKRRAIEKLNNGDLEHHWAKAMKKHDGETGIFALTHFPQKGWAAYKISDSTDLQEIATDFLNRILHMVQVRISKGRISEDSAYEYDDALIKIADAFFTAVPWRAVPANQRLAEASTLASLNTIREALVYRGAFESIPAATPQEIRATHLT